MCESVSESVVVITSRGSRKEAKFTRVSESQQEGSGRLANRSSCDGLRKSTPSVTVGPARIFRQHKHICCKRPVPLRDADGVAIPLQPHTILDVHESLCR